MRDFLIPLESKWWSLLAGEGRARTPLRAPAVKGLTALPLGIVVFAVTLASAQPLPTNQTLVTQATVGQVARSTLGAPQSTYWQGEVFPLTHTLSVDKRHYQSLAGSFTLGAGAINAEDWSRMMSAEADGRLTLTQTSRAYSTQGGSVRVPAGTQAVVLVARVNEGAFGSNPEADTFTLTSSAPLLTFRPLPAPAPAAFGGAVGEFTLSSTVSAASAKVGEAVTWTIKVAGTGNWPEIRSLPGRAVAKDFDYVKPVLKRSLQLDTLFDGDLSEELLLVPTKVGAYRLGPVRFVYFNPKEGKYQQLTSEALTLNVTAPVPGGGVAGVAGAPAERVRVPAAPPTLPLDPQSGASFGGEPWSASGVFWGCLVAPALFVGCWLRLAAQRRWVTDPLRPRREAQIRMLAVIDTLRGEILPAGAELRGIFFEWQQATAVFAGVTSSAPMAPEIAAAIGHIAPGAKGEEWGILWRESNWVIFAQTPKVPPGWAHRARAAIAATTLPAVPVSRLFRRQNLFPVVALAAIALLLPAKSRADAGTDAYRTGDFIAAEKAWSAAAAKEPTNANLRYNLSLAAAQQDRWSEAAAQALAAFCLDPASPAIRWQFQLSLDRAGIDHPFLAQLAHGTGFGRVARTFSPSGWGWLALAASVVFAGTLGLAAWAAFCGKPRVWRRGGIAVALLALLGGVTAFASLHSYGELADRNIAVVAQSTLLASVPTEADTGQKTAPLPAGSLATVDGRFLTWSRLKFANGQTGWVRTKLITFIYRAPGK